MSSLKNIELNAQEASSYDCFKEIDLLKIKDKLADILSHLRTMALLRSTLSMISPI